MAMAWVYPAYGVGTARGAECCAVHCTGTAWALLSHALHGHCVGTVLGTAWALHENCSQQCIWHLVGTLWTPHGHCAGQRSSTAWALHCRGAAVCISWALRLTRRGYCTGTALDTVWAFPSALRGCFSERRTELRMITAVGTAEVCTGQSRGTALSTTWALLSMSCGHCTTAWGRPLRQTPHGHCRQAGLCTGHCTGTAWGLSMEWAL